MKATALALFVALAATTATTNADATAIATALTSSDTVSVARMQIYPQGCSGTPRMTVPLGTQGSCQFMGLASEVANCSAQTVSVYLGQRPTDGSFPTPPTCQGTPNATLPFQCSQPFRNSNVGLGFFCRTFNTTETPLLLWTVYAGSCASQSANSRAIRQHLIFLNTCQTPPRFDAPPGVVGGGSNQLSGAAGGGGGGSGRRLGPLFAAAARDGQPDLLRNDSMSFIFSVVKGPLGNYRLSAQVWEGVTDCSGANTAQFALPITVPTNVTNRRGIKLCGDVTPVGSGSGASGRLLQTATSSNTFVLIGDPTQTSVPDTSAPSAAVAGRVVSAVVLAVVSMVVGLVM